MVGYRAEQVICVQKLLLTVSQKVLKVRLKLLLVLFLFCFFQAATKKQKYEKISEKKMSTPVEVLCKVRKCRKQ